MTLEGITTNKSLCDELTIKQLEEKVFKLNGEVLNGKIQNHKQTREILSLKYKLERQACIERELLNSIKSYRDGIDQLKKRPSLNECIPSDHNDPQQESPPKEVSITAFESDDFVYSPRIETTANNDEHSMPIDFQFDLLSSFKSMPKELVSSSQNNRSIDDSMNDTLNSSILWNQIVNESSNLDEVSDELESSSKENRSFDHSMNDTSNSGCDLSNVDEDAEDSIDTESNKTTIVLDFPFNLSLFDSYGKCFIYWDTMNQIQISEFKKIKEYLKNYLLDSLDQEIHFNLFYKGRETFICYLKCANYNCSSKFKVTIDQLATKEAILTYNAVCENCEVN